MIKFKVKPPVIEAIQWSGDNLKEIEKNFIVRQFDENTIILHPDTLAISVMRGQYIVKQHAGHQHPGPDIEVMGKELFESTFDVEK